MQGTGLNTIELTRQFGETRILGQQRLDEPAWHWPERWTPAPRPWFAGVGSAREQGSVVEMGQHMPGEPVGLSRMRVAGQDEGLEAEVRVAADLG